MLDFVIRPFIIIRTLITVIISVVKGRFLEFRVCVTCQRLLNGLYELLYVETGLLVWVLIVASRIPASFVEVFLIEKVGRRVT